MKNLLLASAAVFSFVISSPSFADDWFRLNMVSPIYLSGSSDSDGININVDPSPVDRIYGDIELPVTVSGSVSDHVVNVVGLPSGAIWSPGPGHSGSITWPTASSGAYNIVVEVRDSDGELVASQDVELTVFEELTASVPNTAYTSDVDGALSISPSVGNGIGNITWGLSSSLPWLNFNSNTGVIDVDTSSSNSVSDIFLTAADSFDGMTADTQLFSITINGVDTDYWVATLGGSAGQYTGRGITSGPNGSFYITGHSGPITAGNLIVAKYSSTGELDWQRSLGGSPSNLGFGTAVATDGSLYVVGQTHSTAGGYRVLLAKYNSDGDLDWRKTSGAGSGVTGDHGHDVSISADGSIFVTGINNNTGTADLTTRNMLVAKYYSNGDLDWSRSYGGSELANGDGIATGPGNSAYAVGVIGDGAARDALAVKYNSSGGVEWANKINGGGPELYYGSAVGSDGALYATGTAWNGSRYVAFTAKYLPNGNLDWANSFSGPGSTASSGRDVAIGSDGSVYVVGTIPGNSNDILVLKYSSSGNLLWSKALGGTSNNQGYGIDIGSDNAIYIVGTSNAAGSGLEIVVARLPSDGGQDMDSEHLTWRDTNTTGMINFTQQPLGTTSPAASLPVDHDPTAITILSNPGFTPSGPRVLE